MSDDPQPSDTPPPGAAGSGPQGRLRLVEVRTEHRPDAGVRIVVELEGGNDRHVGEVEGVGTGVAELRMAATATLEAVRRAVPDTRNVRLVGMKTVRAFDAELVLAGLRSPWNGGQHLIGAVPAHGDPDRAAAAAVLDALNRVLHPSG